VNIISTWQGMLPMNHAHAVSVPRLHTDRLTLREYRIEDFALSADHLSHPESSAHLGVADRQTAWRIFNSHAGLWLLNQAGWWCAPLCRCTHLGRRVRDHHIVVVRDGKALDYLRR
jgi:hypothetical protein